MPKENGCLKDSGMERSQFYISMYRFDLYPFAHITYIHTYVRTYVHTYIHTNKHTYIYICSHLDRSIDRSIHTYVRTNVPTYVPTYINTYIHTNIHTFIHTYTQTLFIYIYWHIKIQHLHLQYIFKEHMAPWPPRPSLLPASHRLSVRPRDEELLSGGEKMPGGRLSTRKYGKYGFIR